MGLVVFKIECLIHIDLSRSKNPAIARSCCTKDRIFNSCILVITKIQDEYEGEYNGFRDQLSCC